MAEQVLPPGWRLEVVKRVNGASAGASDKYWYTPSGERFRSWTGVQKYLKEHPSDISSGDAANQPSTSALAPVAAAAPKRKPKPTPAPVPVPAPEHAPAPAPESALAPVPAATSTATLSFPSPTSATHSRNTPKRVTSTPRPLPKTRTPNASNSKRKDPPNTSGTTSQPTKKRTSATAKNREPPSKERKKQTQKDHHISPHTSEGTLSPRRDHYDESSQEIMDASTDTSTHASPDHSSSTPSPANPQDAPSSPEFFSADSQEVLSTRSQSFSSQSESQSLTRHVTVWHTTLSGTLREYSGRTSQKNSAPRMVVCNLNGTQEGFSVTLTVGDMTFKGVAQPT
eukprot:TRINITY_DN5853_c0_g1_i2.p1 TRINITY_DN5853_c0_g1~~TRINITY_DN5853_c0_g1_i2.p1  ORF type:complete len:349 (-),score=35.61 TRINITY_DN5853_c0_g1_i2:123-1145(-)